MPQQINEDQVKNLTTDLAAKAPLASPALTGIPTAPTATAGTNTTQIATTAFVEAALGASTPIATATTVGTVKPGTGLSVATDGTLNLSLSAPHFVSNTASANSNSGANLVATFGANVTAGNAILVVLAPGPGHNPGATITSITDNHGNSYSLVMNVPGAGPDGFGTYYGSQLIYAAYNVAAGATTITVVYSQLNGQLSLLALEYAGVVSASPVDGTPASTASTGTSLTAGPVATANANDLLISSCAFATTYSPLTNTPPAGYTQEASVALGGREIWVADQAVSATGSYSATWTNNDTGFVASKTVALFALKSAGASSAFVTSFNGRAGIVTSQPGDYSDAQIAFSDITTNNVSTSAHGYAPKLPGDATKYFDGTGVFSVPPTATGTNATQIQGVNVSATAPTTNQVLQYNGTQYVPATVSGATYQPSVLPNPPALSSWTWVNQGAATVSNNGSSLAITIPNTAALNWRLLKMATPSTPYSFAAYWKSIQFEIDSQDTGFYLYDGTKLLGIEVLTQSAGKTLRVERINSVTADNSTVNSYSLLSASAAMQMSDPMTGGLYARWRNNGTTLFADISVDGSNWTNIYSEAVGAFITPTAVAFGGVCVTGTSTNYVVNSLQGWLQTASAAL